jgi:hypothetical protein
MMFIHIFYSRKEDVVLVVGVVGVAKFAVGAELELKLEKLGPELALVDDAVVQVVGAGQHGGGRGRGRRQQERNGLDWSPFPVTVPRVLFIFFFLLTSAAAQCSDVIWLNRNSQSDG